MKNINKAAFFKFAMILMPATSIVIFKRYNVHLHQIVQEALNGIFFIFQATCSKDGTVRIYEAPDIMNLSQWQLQVCFPYNIFLALYLYLCFLFLVYSIL